MIDSSVCVLWTAIDFLDYILKYSYMYRLFLCEYCESFKNSYFEEHLPEAASGGVL